jgi:putative transposase
VQIDGIHISEHLVLVAALGIDSEGFKHPLGLMEGATEHSAVVGRSRMLIARRRRMKTSP